MSESNAEKDKNGGTILYTGALILTAAIWGSGFPITKRILDSGVTPYEFLGIRFIGAFLLMLLYLIIKKINLQKSDVKKGLFLGCFLFLAFAFQTVGADHTTATKSSFITGFNVVVVPFVYWIISKQRPKMLVYLVSVMCFIGIGVLSLDSDFTISYGDFLTLICAIFYAIHIALTGHVLKKSDPMIITCFQMLSVGVLSIIANLLFEKATIVSVAFSSSIMISIFYMIVFNTVICFLLQTYSQKFVAPAKVAVILSTEMVFGGIFSIIIQGDPISFRMILGGIIIFSSILILELKNLK